MGDLRRAGPADAADLTRLRAHMLVAMGDDVSSTEWAHACEVVLARRLAEPERFAAWLVDVDGTPVSCGVGWVVEHLPLPRMPDARRGHIASMSTHPAHRRQGYGRLVFGALMGWFASLVVQRVDLRATEQGRPLYEEHGFRELGGSSMAWTASAAAAPGLGFATRP